MERVHTVYLFVDSRLFLFFILLCSSILFQIIQFGWVLYLPNLGLQLYTNKYITHIWKILNRAVSIHTREKEMKTYLMQKVFVVSS